MTDDGRVLVSVGMPLRNEGRYLREALESMVRQEGVRLEIILSDNASTDETQQICEDFCRQYDFISYHRFDENTGSRENFVHVLNRARGEHFIWASGHDVWDPNYLQACSEALCTHPGAVIAFGTTRWIDGDGRPFDRNWGWVDTRGMSLVGRYFSVFWGNMNPIISLIRTEDLKAQEIHDMVGTDLAILLALSLRGDFMHVPETGWSRREFRTEQTYEERLQRYRSKDFALDTSWLARVFPLARLPLTIVRDLLRAAVPVSSRASILPILLVSLPVKYLADRRRKRSDT